MIADLQTTGHPRPDHRPPDPDHGHDEGTKAVVGPWSPRPQTRPRPPTPADLTAAALNVDTRASCREHRPRRRCARRTPAPRAGRGRRPLHPHDTHPLRAPRARSAIAQLRSGGRALLPLRTQCWIRAAQCAHRMHNASYPLRNALAARRLRNDPHPAVHRRGRQKHETRPRTRPRRPAGGVVGS